MDFVAVVDQVIALLRQRGRVTYSTLKRQFQLDDAALEDVKNELIEGQRLAVDEQGQRPGLDGRGGRTPTRAITSYRRRPPAPGSAPTGCPTSTRRRTASAHRDVLRPRRLDRLARSSSTRRTCVR